jgi:orotate phosphoribosyltransferase
MPGLTNHQKNFINAAIDAKALVFGEFTLKSGRISPYFFNASRLLGSAKLIEVIDAFAAIIEEEILNYDQIFGPAYKGTIFGSMVGMKLKNTHPNLGLCFDRKEIKDHGEGGLFIGEEPRGKVIIIDDVLSAGTAAKASINLIKESKADPKMLVIGLDRQEKGSGDISAKEELQNLFGLEVKSVISLDNLIQFVASQEEFNAWEEKLSLYREEWGG